MEIWANATKEIAMAGMGSDSTTLVNTDIDFLLSIIEENRNIPVLLVDDSDNIILHRNFRLPEPVDETMPYYISPANEEFLKHKLSSMKGSRNCIELNIDSNTVQRLYYEDSDLLVRLSIFPYIQLVVMLVFIAIVYFAVVSMKKAEQNKVWVGLSKETAHQLGTPISSLMAWQEVLWETYPDDSLLPEMGKDVERLQRIAERFSKIGSLPELRPESLDAVLDNVTQYISRRASNRVHLSCVLPQQPIIVPMCSSLFEWVVENLCKNAIDAMEGEGSIVLTAFCEDNHAVVEVSDTGKGIPRNMFRTVFTPGFTTKKRGWGLGLSLAKRIVEEYHHGRIYVKSSEVGHGTTFRIELKIH